MNYKKYIFLPALLLSLCNQAMNNNQLIVGNKTDEEIRITGILTAGFYEACEVRSAQNKKLSSINDITQLAVIDKKSGKVTYKKINFPAGGATIQANIRFDSNGELVIDLC